MNDENGNEIGALVVHKEHPDVAQLVYVNTDHQRKGIATALYNHAETHLGTKFRPSNIQSQDAVKFWSHRNA